MTESRALSSYDGTYNSLKDVQRIGQYDYGNNLTNFNNQKYSNSKPNHQMMDTKTYLEQLEQKYSKKTNGYNDSDSDDFSNDCSPNKAASQVPTKFQKSKVSANIQNQPEFKIPVDINLSRGPSEIGQDYKIIQDMNEKYGSIAQSRITIVDQDAKRRFFELALEMKKELPQNHPGQSMLVAQLYTESVQKQISEKYWRQWLQTRLKN
ncbi:unnamed protein product [Paramecium pentaurelia]|uniref:Uncharacterized protein n=1 Tax=Paramecium pentaurelia TaxID=43138 RepID=A0A8S1S8C5_9CILI|nr:unnamed protein product [Paramecium pentaurelia]